MFGCSLVLHMMIGWSIHDYMMVFIWGHDDDNLRAYSVHEDIGWQNSEGTIANIRLVNIPIISDHRSLYPLLFPHLPQRIVPDQDDHVACQKFCAETAHCIGYTFVKVVSDVVGGVVIVLVVVAIVICVDKVIPTPLSRMRGGATSRTPMVPRVLQTTGVQWYLGRRNLHNNCVLLWDSIKILENHRLQSWEQKYLKSWMLSNWACSNWKQLARKRSWMQPVQSLTIVCTVSDKYVLLRG